MGRFDGILLITDFDGTLSWDGTISPENCEAIRYFQANGGLFTIASGRQPSWLIENWLDYVCPNTWLAAINGAVLYDLRTGEYAFRQTAGRELFALADRIFATLPKLRYVNHSLMDRIQRQDPDQHLPEEIVSQPIYKSVFRVPDEYSDEYPYMREHLPEKHEFAQCDLRAMKEREWASF